MSYPPGTKVICIDANPIPILAPAFTGLDFTFPRGFLSEGTTYCVERATENADGSFGLHLTGLPIYCRDREANWHHLRFRKIEAKSLTKSRAEQHPITRTEGLYVKNLKKHDHRSQLHPSPC